MTALHKGSRTKHSARAKGSAQAKAGSAQNTGSHAAQGAVHRTRTVYRRRQQERKCSRALALRSGCRMRSAIYKSSIAALCGLGSPPAAGFGRLAAVHSTRPVAALYPYSACAAWDGSGDQRLRVGWLVGVYARIVPSSMRLQKRYLVGMILALCDTHRKTTILKVCPQGRAQDAPRDFRAMAGHHTHYGPECAP